MKKSKVYKIICQILNQNIIKNLLMTEKVNKNINKKGKGNIKIQKSILKNLHNYQIIKNVKLKKILKLHKLQIKIYNNNKNLK